MSSIRKNNKLRIQGASCEWVFGAIFLSGWVICCDNFFFGQVVNSHFFLENCHINQDIQICTGDPWVIRFYNLDKSYVFNSLSKITSMCTFGSYISSWCEHVQFWCLIWVKQCVTNLAIIKSSILSFSLFPALRYIFFLPFLFIWTSIQTFSSFNTLYFP